MTEPTSKHRDGWTGRPCPDCKGSGVRPDCDTNSSPCGGCGGTGEEYVSALDEREDQKEA